MVGIILSAVILGVVVALMEQDEFPDVWRLIACALAAGVSAALVRSVLPGSLAFLGTLFGAACAAVALALLLQLPLRRAGLAAAIFTVVELVFGYLLSLVLRV